MTIKRTAGAAAAAAGISVSALLMATGPANAVPLAPPPSCDQANPADCRSGPGGSGDGGDHGQRLAPQAPEGPHGDVPQDTPPQAPPGNDYRQGPDNDNAPQGPSNNPQAPQGNPPANAPQGPQNNGPQGNGPDNRGADNRFDNPPGRFDRGNDQVGGPRDAPHGFSTPDDGAPPPPPERGLGWNDGPPPGAPPPDWDGPPPPGGWDGPPPAGGWNRRYDGPPRDIAAARLDFGPFNYNGYTAIPVLNPVFGGWGFWFFGVWIPLF